MSYGENYGEEIAYWYLRLNGFFPITNFVIHKSTKVSRSSDCDLLALRMPYVYEEIGGKPDDWDSELIAELDFGSVIGIICEVKTGRYSVNKIFRPEYIHYALGRLGLIMQGEIDRCANELNNNAIIRTPQGYCICKLLIATTDKGSRNFIFKELCQTEDFINSRVERYPQEKYADRMYFRSNLFGHTIHRIHRKRQKEFSKLGMK